MGELDPIVAKLREIRVSEGWTQADVAALIGVSRTQVTNLESGRFSPSMRRLRQWCAALGVDLQLVLHPDA